jgi:hypothetical protein
MNFLRIPFFATDGRTMRRVFSAIHARRAWGDGESVSGPGSSRARAETFLPDLISLVQSLGTRTLLDAPCGDFNWAGALADSVDRYIGVDVVPALIENNHRYANAKRAFVCLDMAQDPLPPADLVFCRDALIHLSFVDIRRTLANFRRTGAEYLITTTFVGEGRRNRDIRTGSWRPLNLQKAPFGFSKPIAVVDENCHHSGGIFADKRLALWRLDDIG